MAVHAQQVSVSDTETLVAQGNPTTPVTVHLRVNSGGDSVFIGDAGLADTDGYEIEGGGSTESVVLQEGDELYALTAGGGSSTLNVLEIDG